MRVLVTGGSGFIGKRLEKVKPFWFYMRSSDCDLTDPIVTFNFLQKNRPDAIVHLASKVGGIKENSENQANFYYTNTMINTNLLNCAYKLGIKRVLSAVSTCAFPDTVLNYPFVEEDIFSGPPARTNFTYGYTKRCLHVMSSAYRQQYGVNFSTFCPSNVYGPEDCFNLDKSHFVSAMIRKFIESAEGDTIEFWGTGSPLRQQLYVDDLCKIIPILLEKHNSDIPIIVAPNENLDIASMIHMCKKLSHKNVNYFFNGRLEGQHRKDGSNKKLLELIGNFEFTTFKVGLEHTYNWYKENYA